MRKQCNRGTPRGFAGSLGSATLAGLEGSSQLYGNGRVKWKPASLKIINDLTTNSQRCGRVSGEPDKTYFNR